MTFAQQAKSLQIVLDGLVIGCAAYIRLKRNYAKSRGFFSRFEAKKYISETGALYLVGGGGDSEHRTCWHRRLGDRRLVYSNRQNCFAFYATCIIIRGWRFLRRKIGFVRISLAGFLACNISSCCWLMFIVLSGRERTAMMGAQGGQVGLQKSH
jgi:hypothetical protein